MAFHTCLLTPILPASFSRLLSVGISFVHVSGVCIVGDVVVSVLLYLHGLKFEAAVWECFCISLFYLSFPFLSSSGTSKFSAATFLISVFSMSIIYRDSLYIT